MFDIFAILHWLRLHISRRDILIALSIILLFLATRLINIKGLPIFCDEGIYIRWAKSANINGDARFISLTDGRQPLQTWGTIPFLKIFPNDPLVAGRLFGVFSGLFGLLGASLAATYLFGKKAGFVAGLLYVITPYFLFYDRMAMIDSFVNAAAIWIFFLAILLVRFVRIDLALATGLFFGLASLAKSTVQLFLGLAFLAPSVFLWRRQDWKHKLINILVLFGIAGTISFLIYSVQRLSNDFHRIGNKNETFIIGLDKFLQNPIQELSLFFNNVSNVLKFLSWESGLLLVIAAFIGIYQLLKHKRRFAIYLIVWLAVPIILIGIFNRVIYPRYFIFLAGIMILPASYFLVRFKFKIQALSVIFVINLFFNIPIIFNPVQLWFPPVDKGQYIISETAGWAVDPILNYLRTRIQDKPILLVAEGDFGLSGDMFESLLVPQDRIFIKGAWPLTREFLLQQQAELQKMEVYVVRVQRSDEFVRMPEDLPIELVQEYANPVSNRVWQLFTLSGKK